jgi:3-oxoacyl-(acyl-carrier-protein) synthase
MSPVCMQASTSIIVLGAGSVKACYGHTEGAAGIHGALLALAAVQTQVGCFTACCTMEVISESAFTAHSSWVLKRGVASSRPVIATCLPCRQRLPSCMPGR